MNYLQFRESLFGQGVFSIRHVRLLFPGFNTDNLLQWQEKGYIIKLRNSWYCFKELKGLPGYQYLVANNIYSPSYISHQEALMHYGLIPEHITDSTSITTRITKGFTVEERYYKYYSVKPEFYFGYRLMDLEYNNVKRQYLIAEPEKALLDLLYSFNFYRTEQDMEDLRLNESVLENDMDWQKLSGYLARFKVKTLDKKIKMIQKVYSL
jgi:predicted transcriptional regulator of viral defense system